MIDVYTWPTPNGHKVHIMLEETGLRHCIGPVNRTWRSAGPARSGSYGRWAASGPMMGQANHFRRYAKESIPYAIERYTSEANRLTNVLDKRLAESQYVACDDYTIADISIFPWMRGADARGVVLDDYPNVKRWYEAIDARPAVQRGLQVLASEQSSAPHDEKAWEIMFGKVQFQRR